MQCHGVINMLWISTIIVTVSMVVTAQMHACPLYNKRSATSNYYYYSCMLAIYRSRLWAEGYTELYSLSRMKCELARCSVSKAEQPMQ